jgi:hypothetical protein
MASAEKESRGLHPALLFVLIFLAVFALHIPLLRLPYYWDEAGYYVPAAHDLLNGSLIPHSTPSNAHPPLVLAWLALCWKICGFSPVVTRTAMLVVSSFSLLGIFRLAKRVANLEVAVASTVCTALYPVYFAQSSLAQVDLAAAGLIFWGLLAYVEERPAAMIAYFSLAALAKETAIFAPLALWGWELLSHLLAKTGWMQRLVGPPRGWKSLALLVPVIPLVGWYGYHYWRTGIVFGNAEFFRYNVQATMHPARMLLAMLMRLWQTLGYMNLYLLSAAALLAMWVPAIGDKNGKRPRIAPRVQLAFLAVVIAYVIAMAVLGGAVLARYMLPAVPLVIIILVSTLWRRVQFWRGVVAITALGFVVGLFVNPPHGFSMEDNLAYRDFIILHQRAETFVEARYPMARVLTAWPANDELTRPALGYVTRPVQVVRIEDFRLEELQSAAEMRQTFDVAMIFSTKYEPPHSLLENWAAWQRIKARFFDYHRDLPPEFAAKVLGGKIVYNEARNGQWIAVIETESIFEAHNSTFH